MVPSEASVGVSTYFVNPYLDHLRVMAHVAAADSLYFAMHPETDARLRFFVPGEIPITVDARYMLVLRVGERSYVRVPLALDDEQAARFQLAFAREELAA
ncbi:MAG: hypothetical protein M3Z36_03460 [Acidobacteriota bacterium]|nr:hypothetical protein [Acidobacteriota bacterium]